MSFQREKLKKHPKTHPSSAFYSYYDDELNFTFYGTPLDIRESDKDEGEKYVSASKRLKQKFQRDERVQERFHGAFTGGFSAGYWNTVGSAEGFTPREFVSRRDDRSRTKFHHCPEDYMDEEDFSEFGIAPKRVRVNDEFSATGSSQTRLSTGLRQDDGQTYEGVVDTIRRLIDAPSAQSGPSIGEIILRNMLRHSHNQKLRRYLDTDESTCGEPDTDPDSHSNKPITYIPKSSNNKSHICTHKSDSGSESDEYDIYSRIFHTREVNSDQSGHRKIVSSAPSDIRKLQKLSTQKSNFRKSLTLTDCDAYKSDTDSEVERSDTNKSGNTKSDSQCTEFNTNQLKNKKSSLGYKLDLGLSKPGKLESSNFSHKSDSQNSDYETSGLKIGSLKSDSYDSKGGKSDLNIDDFCNVYESSTEIDESSEFVYKNDLHGIGYKPLKAASTSRLLSVKPLAISAVLRGDKKLNITGEAFGYGYCGSDDEDEVYDSIDLTSDIYGTDDVDNYDFDSGFKSSKSRGRNINAKKSSMQIHSDETEIRLSYGKRRSKFDTPIIEGFVPAMDECLININEMLLAKYQPPQVPPNWRPRPRSILQKIQSLKDSHPANTQKIKLESNTTNPTKLGTDVNHIARTSSGRSFQPLSTKLASKFISAHFEDDPNKIKPGLSHFSDLKSLSKNIQPQTPHKDDTKTQDCSRSVGQEKEQFIVSRQTFEWTPTALLCKRFNVTK